MGRSVPAATDAPSKDGVSNRKQTASDSAALSGEPQQDIRRDLFEQCVELARVIGKDGQPG